MKRYLSVYAMAARASFVKVLAVTLLVALICGLMLWNAPSQGVYSIMYSLGHVAEIKYDVPSGSIMISKSACDLTAIVGFIIIALLLSRIGTGNGSVPVYTVMRLRVKQWAVAALWSAYNFVVLLFYRAMLVLAIYGVISYRLKTVGPQAVLIASYENSFLHNLLPLRDFPAWMLLFSVTVLAACCCTSVSSYQWQGKRTNSLVFPCGVLILIISMRMSMGSPFAIILSMVSWGITAVIAFNIFGETKDEFED